MLQANDDLRRLWVDVSEAKEAENSIVRELPDKIKAMKQVLSMPVVPFTDMSSCLKAMGLQAFAPTIAKWLGDRKKYERLVACYEQGAVLKPRDKDERNAGIKADLAAGLRLVMRRGDMMYACRQCGM